MEAYTYKNEEDLLEFFAIHLNSSSSPWGGLRFSREFYYKSGRADVIAVNSDGVLLAFEGKLEKWRKALEQAYRNLCFAHISYVVLPKAAAMRAFRFEAAFRKRGVGLCYMEGLELVILVEAESVEPIQPWITDLAFIALGEEDGNYL